MENAFLRSIWWHENEKKIKNKFLIQLLLINTYIWRQTTNIHLSKCRLQTFKTIENYHCRRYRLPARHFTGKLFYDFYHNLIRLDHFHHIQRIHHSEKLNEWSADRLYAWMFSYFTYSLLHYNLPLVVSFIFPQTHLDSLVTPRHKRDYLLSFTGCAQNDDNKKRMKNETTNIRRHIIHIRNGTGHTHTKKKKIKQEKGANRLTSICILHGITKHRVPNKTK